MDFVFVTGKLGQGKTLAAMNRVKEKIESGCVIATNCDIFLDKMFHRKTDKPRVIRIPDKPTLEHLEAIGRGRPKEWGYMEEKNGLLVLDECGDWFNSRNWADKTRSGVNSWFRHARKLGWDVYLIVQDISIVDSQARESLAASIARCKRMDKVSIPFITQFSKWFLGYPIRPNKFHMARLEDADGLFLDRWIYRGTGLYHAYDTEQIFRSDYPHGPHSLLTPWHIYGRHAVQMNWENIMRLTRIYWRRFSRPAVAVASAFLTAACTWKATYDYYQPDIQPGEQMEVTQQQEQPQPLQEQFADWRYDGAMEINRRSTFYFRSPEGHLYTSNSPKFAGMTFREYGFCQIEIIKGSDSAILTCPPDKA